jgi:hypothetical protein
MTLNLRSFAEILAGMQGGIRLKPGGSVSRKLTRDQVKQIFGDEETVAYSSASLTISVRQISEDEFVVTVGSGSTIT